MLERRGRQRLVPSHEAAHLFKLFAKHFAFTSGHTVGLNGGKAPVCIGFFFLKKEQRLFLLVAFFFTTRICDIQLAYFLRTRGKFYTSKLNSCIFFTLARNTSAPLPAPWLAVASLASADVAKPNSFIFV